MAGPVEKIYVEIGAPIQQLDRDMRKAESRVDAGAKKMSQTAQRATSRFGALAGMGGVLSRVTGVGTLGGLGALALANRTIDNYRAGSGSRPYGDAPKGLNELSSAADKVTDGFLDVYDSLMRSMPIISGLYEKWKAWLNSDAITDETGKIGERFTRSAQLAELRKKIEFDALAASPDAATALYAQERVAAEEIRKALETRISEIKALTDNPEAQKNIIRDAVNAAMAQQSALERKTDERIKALETPKPAAHARFDTINTVFGAMKLPSRMNTDKAAAETAKNTKRGADAAEKTARLLERGGVAIVGFA